MEELDFKGAKLHFFICVALREENKVCCGPKVSRDDFKDFNKKIKEKYAQKVKLTRTYCLGVCPRNGFVVLAQPINKYFRVDKLEEIEDLISKYL